jgi:RND family efflux transporter MFP subunit
MNSYLGSRLALVALLIATAACDRTEARNRMDAEPTAAPPVIVRTAVAEPRRVPGLLDVTGTLMADAQADVAAEIAARVVQVFVERGAVVKAGTPLARLDGEDAGNQLREAEAMEAQTMERLGLVPGEAFDAANTPDARKAHAAVERMQAEERRYARLLEQAIVSRSEYEQKRMDALSAVEQYQSTLYQMRQLYQGAVAQRARVSLARRAVADAVVRAPFDGLVAERHVTAGQFLARGGRVATLVRIDPLRVELSVPEAAVATIRRGQRVAFTVQAYPDRTFEGTIAYVGPALRSESRALVVEAVVANPKGELQPGLFAAARIELPAGAEGLFVPATAVRTDAGVSRLFVVGNDRAEQRLVQIGRTVGPLVEIVRGVARDEMVVVDGVDRLIDGAAITMAGAR